MPSRMYICWPGVRNKEMLETKLEISAKVEYKMFTVTQTEAYNRDPSLI